MENGKLAIAASVLLLSVLWFQGLLMWTDLGFVLAAVLLLESKLIVAWNTPKVQKIVEKQIETLTPMRLQAIADTARNKEEDMTLFKFIASCKKITFESLKSLLLVDLNPKLLAQKMQDKDFRSVRISFLRNIAKKLTHPIYGISSSSGSTESEEKFRGFEIVDWIAANFGLQRVHAVEIGLTLQGAGVLVPLKRVVKNVKKKIRFGDKMRHWKFDYLAIDKTWPEERQALRQGRKVSTVVDSSSMSLAPIPRSPRQATAVVQSSRGSKKNADSTLKITSSAESSGGYLVSPMGVREWQYIFAAGKTETFSAGTELMKEGSPNDRLFRITKGSVQITEKDKVPIVVSEDGIFGEESCSFLLGTNVSTISASAFNGSVSVQLVDSQTLAKLLKIEPVVSKVFWRYLASRRAVRHNANLTRTKEEEQMAHSTASPAFSSNRKSSGATTTATTTLLSRDSTGRGRKSSKMVEISSKNLTSYFPEWRSGDKPTKPKRKISQRHRVQSYEALDFENDQDLLDDHEPGGGGGEGSNSNSNNNNNVTGEGEDDGLLIKKYNVRWLKNRSQLFVTQKGIGVLSHRALLKQSVSFNRIQSVDQKVAPNRRNGFDFVLSIVFVSTNKRQANSVSTVELSGNHGDAPAPPVPPGSVSVPALGEKMGSTGSVKIKKKEMVLSMEDGGQLRAAFELIEHLRNSSKGADLSQDMGDVVRPFHEFDLTPEDWQKLTEKSTIKTVAKGLCITIAGSPVTCLYQIISGKVSIISHGTTDRVFGSLGDGDFIGDADFAIFGSHLFTYIAESDCECVLLDVESLKVLFIQDPGLGGRLFRFLCSTIVVTDEKK